MEDVLKVLGDLLGWLSPGSLLEDPRTREGPAYYAVFGTIFGLSTMGGVVGAIGANRFSRGHRVHRRLIARYAAWAIWLGVLGLIAVGLRATSVLVLSKRLWTMLEVWLMIAVAVHFVWYMRRGYAADLAGYAEQERRRRLAPPRRGRSKRRR